MFFAWGVEHMIVTVASSKSFLASIGIKLCILANNISSIDDIVTQSPKSLNGP
jgi:hypothetical protein